VTGYRSASGLGARIQALRKFRGMRTARDLADAIDYENLTESIIENIEAGRKTDLPVSQLLNIAYALQVPPTYLLVPLDDPLAILDLPNLSPELASMSPLQFDAWLSGIGTGAFRSPTAADHSSRAELQALRELDALRREQHRIQTINSLKSDPSISGDPSGDLESARLDARQIDVASQIELVETFLRSAGWAL
jgi:transcriptional regulator with XRE-family HTH domain